MILFTLFFVVFLRYILVYQQIRQQQ